MNSTGSATCSSILGTTNAWTAQNTFNLGLLAPGIGSQTGQPLYMQAGNGTGTGGALTIAAGNAGVPQGGAGGNVNIQAGGNMPQGGSGYGNLGPAGAVNIAAAGGYNSIGGNVVISSGGTSPWATSSDPHSQVSIVGRGGDQGDNAELDVEGGHMRQVCGCYSISGGNIRLTAGNGVGGNPAGSIYLTPGTGSTNGIVQVNGALALSSTPHGSCSAANDGAMQFVAGGTGVADQLAMCMKSGAGSYSWKTILTG